MPSVPHDTPFFKLQRHGLDAWTVQWLRNGLVGQRVLYKGSRFRWRPGMSGVSQGCVLGLVVFNIDNEIIECTFSTFADVMKLKCSWHNKKVVANRWREGILLLSSWHLTWSAAFSSGMQHKKDGSLVQRIQRAVKMTEGWSTTPADTSWDNRCSDWRREGFREFSLQPSIYHNRTYRKEEEGGTFYTGRQWQVTMVLTCKKAALVRCQ